MKINIEIGFKVTEKRLLKMGFSQKESVYVLGKNQTDCGDFIDTITYDPTGREISVFYGSSIPFYDKAKVESTLDIKRFLKGKDIENHEIEFEKKYGKKEDKEFAVILLDGGMYRINVMKFMKSYFGFTLTESKELIDNVPQIICNFENRERAEEIMKKFNELGAWAEIE